MRGFCFAAAALAAGVAWAGRPPVAMYWLYDGESFSNATHVADLDYLKENTATEVVTVAPVAGVPVEGNRRFHDQLKELVEHAHRIGMRVTLRTSPVPGFFNEVSDPIAEPDCAQGLTYDSEGTLDAEGRIVFTEKARWARPKKLPALRNDVVGAWVFEKTGGPKGDGSYRPGSLVDVTDRVKVLDRRPDAQTVEIAAGREYAGKTAFLVTVQYFNWSDLFGGALLRQHRRLMEELKDIPLDGMAMDEHGYLTLSFTPNGGGVCVAPEGNRYDGFRFRFYTNAMAEHFRARGFDLRRMLLDMRYAPDGDEGVRIRATNRFFAEVQARPLVLEREVDDCQAGLFGTNLFRNCHSMFHNRLDKADAWRTGNDWWDLPRDYAFTDASFGDGEECLPVRMGVLAATPSRPRFGYNMFYSKDPEDVYRDEILNAPYNFRQFHHAFNDRFWGLGYREEAFTDNVRKLDEAIRMLDGFQSGSFPRLDLLVVFGTAAQANWYPDRPARNEWDVDGKMCVQDKAAELWRAGYRCALVPDTTIRDGRLRLENGRFALNGHAFTHCIFLYPKYARREVYDFLDAAEKAKMPLAVVGRSDIDFEAKKAEFHGKAYSEFSLKIAEEMGVPRSAIPGGAVTEDGGFVLVSRGILDGRATAFDFTVDGVRYTGRNTGVLAYRRGEPLVCTPGGTVEAHDIVNDGGRIQPSVARAVRPDRIDDEATYLKWKWRTDVTDPTSGLGHEALKRGLDAVVAEWKGKEPWAVVKARLVDYLVDNTALGFSRFDCFLAISCWNRFDRPTSKVLWSREAEVDGLKNQSWVGSASRELIGAGGTCYRDYDHSSPDWDVVLKLGFPGMRERAKRYAKDTPFYCSELMVADAMLRFVDRLVAVAEKELAKCGGRTEKGLLEREIDSLKRLRKGPPETVFDVMQFVFIDFIVSEYFDCFQVRSFGAIDRLWLPYYERDVREGRTTEAQFREDFRHFIWQFGSIDNYWGHPLCLGGTKADGTSEYTPFSLILLDVLDREALPTPKIQLKIAKNTPDWLWDKALRMLRNHRSLVLMGEESMARSMAKLGLTADECRRLVVWGCFEWLPPEGNCTSASSVNLVKPLEQMLGDAKGGRLAQPATFDDFKREYFVRLGRVTDLTCKVMRYLEDGLAEINPALVLTLGVDNALKKGEDAFSTGMRYNHTAISEVAFASTVDSLVAVKELVYERKELTLAELGRILADDWRGHEDLRLRMARSHRKWGCGDTEVDALGREVLENFTGRFVGQPNSRGGKFVCYGLNSRGYIDAGRKTGATPDGRRAGEELSKNMAPAIGGDAEGVTAVLRSWRTSVDPAFFPCGLVFDMMLHASSVSGEKGLAALRAICEEYFAAGGCGLNLNIQSVEELKDAQLHPEKYENLQVRVAGWNIRWNDIPKVEQDGFIRRLEAMPR